MSAGGGGACHRPDRDGAGASRSTGRPGTTGSAGPRQADVIDGAAGDDRVGAGRGRGRGHRQRGQRPDLGRPGCRPAARRRSATTGCGAGDGDDQSLGRGRQRPDGRRVRRRQAVRRAGQRHDLRGSRARRDVGRGRRRHAVGARAQGRARAATTSRATRCTAATGNDTFKTRDGEADVIDCGPGVDTALLDFKDVIADATAQNPNGSCEVVNRAATGQEGRGSARETSTPSTPRTSAALTSATSRRAPGVGPEPCTSV